MTVRWSALILGSQFGAPPSPALAAAPDVVRDLAGRAGPIAGVGGDRAHAARTVLHQRRHRDAGLAGRFGLFEPGAGYRGIKNALARSAPGQTPHSTSLEGYIAATILIQAMKQANPLDTERLVDTGIDAQPRPRHGSRIWARRAPRISQEVGHCARRKRHVPTNRT